MNCCKLGAQFRYAVFLFSAKDDRKLFVGGLSWETGEPQLKEYFGKFGEVEAVSLKLNAETGKSRCFAFIIYKESASISKVFEQTEHAINSKKVDVKKAKAKPGKIFIGGLKPDMTEEMIRTAFEAYGTVTEIELPVDKKDNNKRKVRLSCANTEGTPPLQKTITIHSPLSPAYTTSEKRVSHLITYF